VAVAVLPKLAMLELRLLLVQVVMERHLASPVLLLVTVAAVVVGLGKTLVKLMEPVVQVVAARVALAMCIMMATPVRLIQAAGAGAVATAHPKEQMAVQE